MNLVPEIFDHEFLLDLLILHRHSFEIIHISSFLNLVVIIFSPKLRTIDEPFPVTLVFIDDVLMVIYLIL